MAKIFESPDGGKTVYSREIGSTEKKLEHESPEARSLRDKIREQELWRHIFEDAKTNTALREAIDRVKILYHLSKNDGKKQIR